MFIKKIKHLMQYFILLIVARIALLFSFTATSKFFGKLFKFIGPRIKLYKRASDNMSLAMPELQGKEKQNILLDMLENYGHFFGEFLHISSLTDIEYNKIVRGHNLQNLDYLKDGGFIFSAHFGNFEIATRIFLSLNKNVTVVYRKNDNIYIDSFIQKTRENHGVKFASKGKAIRHLIHALKSKEIVIVFIDKMDKKGILVPFFGRNALTNDSIAKLAIQYDVPLVPCFTVRSQDKKYIDVYIESPLKSKSVFELCIEINNTFEKWIRKYPAQWFWHFKRWN